MTVNTIRVEKDDCRSKMLIAHVPKGRKYVSRVGNPRQGLVRTLF